MKKSFILILLCFSFGLFAQKKSLLIDTKDSLIAVGDLTNLNNKLYFSMGKYRYPFGVFCGNSNIQQRFFPKSYQFNLEKKEYYPIDIPLLDSNFLQQNDFYSINNNLVITSGSDYSDRDLYIANSDLKVVKEIKTSSKKDSDPRNVKRMYDFSFLFFTVTDERGYRKLWVSDGTVELTKPFYRNIDDFMIYEYFEYKNGIVMKAATKETDSALFYQSYGEDTLNKITPFIEKSVSVNVIGFLNGDIIFTVKYRHKAANSEIDKFPSTAIWKTDGTLEGTTKIYDFKGYSSVNDAQVIDDKIYLGVFGYLWESDGTKEGTKKLDKQSLSFEYQGKGLFNLLKFKDEIYFFRETLNEGKHIYYLDNQHEIKRLQYDAPPNFDPKCLRIMNNELYFTANTKNGSRELWGVDNKRKSCYQVTFINDGTGSAFEVEDYFFNWFEWNNRFYFIANSSKNGRQLFSTDGKRYKQVIKQKNIFAPSDDLFSYTIIKNELFISYGNVFKNAPNQIWHLKKSNCIF